MWVDILLDTVRKVKRLYDCHRGCPVEASLDVIGGRWKGVILYHLMKGKQRFGELSRHLEGITQRVLTLQLRELEADGLVERKVYAEVPPRVEYSLTERGMTLKPVVEALMEWGVAHGRTVVNERMTRETEEALETHPHD